MLDTRSAATRSDRRPQRTAIASFEHRLTYVFDERWSDRHRLTCVRPALGSPGDVQAFSDILQGVMASSVPLVIVDLARLREADSQLVAALIWSKRLGLERGVRLVLCASRAVADWLEVCRVDHLVDRWDANARTPRPMEGLV